MPVTTYTVIEGEVVSQNQDGTIHDFLPDPLGHTLGLISTDETIEFEWDYFPYEQVPTAFDGATALRYGGTRGYYSDTYSRPHVGARELRTVHGRWMQVDPIWTRVSHYSYTDANPVSLVDPSGMFANGIACPVWNEIIWKFCWQCRKSPWPGCAKSCAAMAEAYHHQCKGPTAGTNEIWVPRPGLGVVPVSPGYTFGAITVLTFTYGECCGFHRKCSLCDSLPDGKAIDCIDRCCAQHDWDIPTGLEWPFAKPPMCACLASCMADGHCYTTECNLALGQMLSIFCI